MAPAVTVHDLQVEQICSEFLQICCSSRDKHHRLVASEWALEGARSIAGLTLHRDWQHLRCGL